MQIPARFNLAAHVLARAADRAGHPALQVLGARSETLSYAALEDRVRRSATALLAEGLAPGDRVLMRLGNRPDFPVLYLAAITAGLIPIPTSALLTTREATAIAEETAPALVVHDGATALPETSARRVAVEAFDDLRGHDLADYALGDGGRPAYIIYTSGTSGRPRAVVHAHRAILARRMMWDGWYGLRPEDRVLHAGAFNWTYTLGTGLMDPWTMGATALIPAPGTTAEALPALLAETGATIFAAAPGIYRRLLRVPLPPLPALRHGLSAGEKLPEALRERWRGATGTDIHEAFGMSECSTFLSGSPDRPAPPGTLGFPQPGRQVRLREDGTIAIHKDDPGLMLGYLDQPEETAARYDGDWFLTGDQGAITAEGAIRYDGRADDMMNAGGVRVSPLEVEAALTSYPGLTEIAVAEVRLRTDLSLIAAFYTGPDVIDETDAARYARDRLAPYKVPRLWVRVDDLPRGANNKLLRKVLRETWERENGQT